MPAEILDGKKAAAHYSQQIKKNIQQREEQELSPPSLAVVLIGEDPASQVYVRNKCKACERVGVLLKNHHLASKTSQQELMDLISELNDDPSINGILVQLPLPKHLDSEALLEHIDANKDVDGFHPYNLGRLAQRRPLLRPCTAYGIIQLLEYYSLKVKGLQASIIGASNLVGRPMALELLLSGATVVSCHRFTQHLDQYIKSADLLIVATGKRGIVKSEWIKPDSIVVDVGIHRLDDGRITGDLDFGSAAEVARWITPVPGGVGPMTINTLLANTLFATARQCSLD